MDLLISAAVNNENNSKQKSAVDKVTEYIKNKIIYKELKQGDRIPTETELCQILDVGRGSVREALKVLEAINLIQIRRGDGTYISRPQDISFSESLLFKMILNDMALDELVDFREQIEVAVVKLAISYATNYDIKNLKEILNEFTDCIAHKPEDYNKLHELDINFHRALAACMKNKLMEEIYLFSFHIFSPMILENYMIGQVKGSDSETTLETHRVIVEAVEKHDIYAGIYGVKLSLTLWKRWIDKQSKRVNFE